MAWARLLDVTALPSGFDESLHKPAMASNGQEETEEKKKADGAGEAAAQPPKFPEQCAQRILHNSSQDVRLQVLQHYKERRVAGWPVWLGSYC